MSRFDSGRGSPDLGRWCVLATMAALLIGALVGPASLVLAQEIQCDAAGDLPCGFEIRQIEVTRPPALFNFQARISKAKLPVSDLASVLVTVKLLRGQEVICMEQMGGVSINDSILNLTIGQQMSCSLDEALAENTDLALQICLGSPTNCLKPVELEGVPFAIKASFAGLAQESFLAETAGQSNYARRASADRDMLIRKQVGTGYFEFLAPTDKKDEASDLYGDSDSFTPFKFGGFIQWTPVRAPGAMILHVAGKDVGTDRLTLLDELVLAASVTTFSGDVVVQPAEDGDGLQVYDGGLMVTGNTEFKDNLHLLGPVELHGPLDVSGPTEVSGSLTAEASSSVLAGGLDIAGAVLIKGALLVTGALDVMDGLVAQSNATIEGILTLASATVKGTMTVLGNSTLAKLTAGTLSVENGITAVAVDSSGTVSVGGDLAVETALVVGGPVLFKGHVVFEGGTGPPGDELDPLYLWAEDEVRSLSLGGAQTLAGATTLGAPLRMEGNQLRNTLYDAANNAPFPCDEAHDGAFYVDTAQEALVYCYSGEFQAVGKDDCGNGLIQPWEECDDGGTANGNGCSAVCTVESGWVCPSFKVQPTTGCFQIPGGCGNGARAANEACDDGNNEAGDGCAQNCVVEAGWSCSGGFGAKSTCTGQPCGDGKVEGTEVCDDGGLAAGDGCSATCQAEAGWFCYKGGPCTKCGSQIGDHCYVVVNHLETRQDARKQCQKLGGYLATIGGSVENTAVLSLNCTGAMGCWIGLSDEVEEGTYEWVKESGSGTASYFKWRAGQPTGESQDCAVATAEGWWDRDCTLEYGYICELEPPVCGDGACSGGETCLDCFNDCGPCPVCGDAECNGDETCADCPDDCGAC